MLLLLVLELVLARRDTRRNMLLSSIPADVNHGGGCRIQALHELELDSARARIMPDRHSENLVWRSKTRTCLLVRDAAPEVLEGARGCGNTAPGTYLV